MIKKDLLKKELDYYSNKNQSLELVKYNKNTINNLFNKYRYFGMTENSYCCYGDKRCCWQEVIEEGNWGLSLDDVKRDIQRVIKGVKKYLYNGEPRLYMCDNNENCIIYIYMRDRLKLDYYVWFSNNEV